MLYSELEIAKWLLHGTDTRSTDIVDDAVEMLSGLVDATQSDIMNPISANTMPVARGRRGRGDAAGARSRGVNGLLPLQVQLEPVENALQPKAVGGLGMCRRLVLLADGRADAA